MRIEGWPKGINNIDKLSEVPVEALRDGLNIDITAKGKPRRRAGRVKRYSGSSIHSLFSCSYVTVFVEGGALKLLGEDYTAQILRSDLHPTAYVSYVEVNGNVYYSNSYQTGKISSLGISSTLGVPHAFGQPLLQISSTGGLPAGTYQVAITFSRIDMEESGSTEAATISIAEGQGISLLNIPQSDADWINIYVTAPNDDVLKFYSSVAIGTTTASITSLPKGRVLQTQFGRPMPPGHIIRYYNGRLWVASGNVLWYSEPMNFGLCKPASNFFQFPDIITVCEPVDNGIYIVSDATYFLNGTAPEDMKLDVSCKDRGIMGTGMVVSAKVFDNESSGEVAFWYGDRGAMIGRSNGEVVPVSEGVLALPSYDSGVTALREQDGIRQLVTALYGSGDSSAYAVGDAVSTEIVRNGIVIT